MNLVALMVAAIDIGLTSHSFHNKSLVFVTQYNRLLMFSAPLLIQLLILSNIEIACVQGRFWQGENEKVHEPDISAQK